MISVPHSLPRKTFFKNPTEIGAKVWKKKKKRHILVEDQIEECLSNLHVCKSAAGLDDFHRSLLSSVIL